MFTNQKLKQLIVPLVIEQILAVLVGMADIMMVSSVSEAAVSGVSLVDSISILIINIFAALATGGAVVAAQYLGLSLIHIWCFHGRALGWDGIRACLSDRCGGPDADPAFKSEIP